MRREDQVGNKKQMTILSDEEYAESLFYLAIWLPLLLFLELGEEISTTRICTRSSHYERFL